MRKFIFIILLLSGCASIPYEEPKKVQLGYTKDQVIQTWGNPERKIETSNALGKMEQWQYGECLNACYLVMFGSDGKVINITSSK